MVLNEKYSGSKQICRRNHTGIGVRHPGNGYIKSSKSGRKKAKDVQAHGVLKFEEGFWQLND